jgi:hypothetical protein
MRMNSTWATSSWAALFAADGMGNLANGYIDEDAAGIVVSDSLTGTYSVDPVELAE